MKPSAEAMDAVYDILLQMTNDELVEAWEKASEVFGNDDHLLALFRHQLMFTVNRLVTGRWKRGVRIHDQTFVLGDGVGNAHHPLVCARSA